MLVRDYKQYLLTALTDTLEKKNTDYKVLQINQVKLKVRIYILFTLLLIIKYVYLILLYI